MLSGGILHIVGVVRVDTVNQRTGQTVAEAVHDGRDDDYDKAGRRGNSDCQADGGDNQADQERLLLTDPVADDSGYEHGRDTGDCAGHRHDTHQSQVADNIGVEVSLYAGNQHVAGVHDQVDDQHDKNRTGNQDLQQIDKVVPVFGTFLHFYPLVNTQGTADGEHYNHCQRTEDQDIIAV